MKFKSVLFVSSITAMLSLSFSIDVNAATTSVTPVNGQAEILLMAKRKGNKNSEHTGSKSPSKLEKHQKGQAAKQNAQTNKQFKKAKKKNPKLSKETFKKSLQKK